ncbi:MAG: histidine kinase [Gracilimonas sp.]|nr:histidine kinase [Gracilimonas sp.]
MKLLTNIVRSRTFQWLLFWVASFWLTLQIFSQTEEIRTLDLIYVGLFHIPMVFAVHVHDQVLFKRLLLNKSFIGYGIGFFFLLGATYFIYLFSFNDLSTWIFPDYYFVALYEPVEIIGFSLVYIFVFQMIDITRSWFSQQQDIARLAQLEEENKKAELQALRSQVNPHFLFNSLNAIYSEALKKTDKAPNMILQLSDLLRYVLDQIGSDRAPLKDELDYLSNYVEMQLMRLNEPSKINFTIDGNPSELTIAPLLLINFVENCFKHADLQKKDGFIRILITINNNTLEFSAENSIPVMSFSQTELRAGTGIENSKKRLELAYPNKFGLELSSDDHIFKTNLYMELT